MQIRGMLFWIFFVFANKAFANDWGFLVKAGFYGDLTTHRPSYSHLVIEPQINEVNNQVQISNQLSNKVVSAEDQRGWPLTVGIGAIWRRSYGAEIGRTMPFRMFDDLGDKRVDTSTTHNYLLLNRYFLLSPQFLASAGLGKAQWNTEVYGDVNPATSVISSKELTGMATLGHLGVDTLLTGSGHDSHFLGLHYYRAGATDFPFRVIELEYTAYFW